MQAPTYQFFVPSQEYGAAIFQDAERSYDKHILQRRPPIVPGRFQPSIVGTSELNCRVRDEQRLRAPPVADTASRGWRSGRNAASVERGNRISGTARVGCNPVPSTQKEKRPSKRIISSLCWHLPIVPGRSLRLQDGTDRYLYCRSWRMAATPPFSHTLAP